MAAKKTAVKADAKAEPTSIEIPSLDIKRANITIVGDTPLIMHRWTEKAKREILDKQMKKAKNKGHDAKNPIEDFIESMYWMSGKPTEYTEDAFAEAIKNGARFQFPAVAFKASAVDAGYRSGVMKNKVTMQGAFHIDCEFIEIKSNIPNMAEVSVDHKLSKIPDGIGGYVDVDEEPMNGKRCQIIPSIREDMVRIAMGTADIRYRGMFENWCAVIPVRYNAGVVSLPQLVNLFNLGGFACGIGEWRVEKGGVFGTYHVE